MRQERFIYAKHGVDEDNAGVLVDAIRGQNEADGVHPHQSGGCAMEEVWWTGWDWLHEGAPEPVRVGDDPQGLVELFVDQIHVSLALGPGRIDHCFALLCFICCGPRRSMALRGVSGPNFNRGESFKPLAIRATNRNETNDYASTQKGETFR